MPERDPHIAVREGENALRDLITLVMQEKYGDDWLKHSGLTHERLDRLPVARDTERKRRPLQTPEERLIYYAELPDLGTIIHKNWELFKPVLGDRKEFDVNFERLDDLRNPEAHNRDLWPYEIDLVFGISGTFRQALAGARSQSDNSDKYYPRFERVTDSLGHAVSYPQMSLNTGKSVKAGDRINYQLSAWDPSGEQPEFRIWIHGVRTRMVVDWTSADTVTVEFDEDLINRVIRVEIQMRGKRTRDVNGNADGLADFYYNGIPNQLVSARAKL